MTSAIAIRKALPEERAALEELQWRSSLTNEAYRARLLANRDVVWLPPEHIAGTLVAEIDGGTAGFAVVLFPSESEAELDGLFVEPELIRSGIGRRLVEAARKLAAGRGATRFKVIAAPQAEGFYRCRGFVVAATVATQFDAALLMVADIGD